MAVIRECLETLKKLSSPQGDRDRLPPQDKSYDAPVRPAGQGLSSQKFPQACDQSQARDAELTGNTTGRRPAETAPRAPRLKQER
jgi:hypothetical protein